MADQNQVSQVSKAEGVDAPSALAPRSCRARDAAIFVPLVVLWFALDMATKAYFNGFAVGQVVAGPFLGLVQFRLAHNTGAAWGMFDDSTFALGVMSTAVCAALTVYLFVVAKRATVVETVGLALIVAGGLGNALDRFTLGYVVDFIDTVFMSFPTFNVADIGVTCGFVIFFAGMLWSMRKERPDELPAGSAPGHDELSH